MYGVAQSKPRHHRQWPNICLPIVLILLLLFPAKGSGKSTKVDTVFSGDIDFTFLYNDIRSTVTKVDANQYLFSSLLNLEVTPQTAEDVFESPWTFYISYQLTALDRFPVDSTGVEFDAYRYWARYIDDSFEIKAGMQKMAYGHCRYLRPLQLFDTIDPDDFTKKTPGTKALVFKGYPTDSLQTYAWAIHNERDSNDFHYGGRVNKVLNGAEYAFTYHKWNDDEDRMKESVYGFDFFADVTIGLWLEHATHKTAFPSDYNQTALGADYTFPNFIHGLHLSVEHMLTSDEDFHTITNSTALFFDMQLNDEDSLFFAATREQTLEITTLNLRINRDLNENMTGVLSFDWVSKDTDDIFTEYNRIVPLHKGASLRVVYSF